MSENQFYAWLIFFMPVVVCFGNKSITFNQSIMLASVFFILIPLPLLIIAENEFIKGCKKGYTDFDESIFPMWFYKKWVK